MMGTAASNNKVLLGCSRGPNAGPVTEGVGSADQYVYVWGGGKRTSMLVDKGRDYVGHSTLKDGAAMYLDLISKGFVDMTDAELSRFCSHIDLRSCMRNPALIPEAFYEEDKGYAVSTMQTLLDNAKFEGEK